MPLTLTIRNVEFLENGSPRSIVLDRRGATIGRAATADWCLPDPSLHVSSRHCDIVFREGGYELVDNSTNGTFLQGHAARLPGPHVLHHGDVFIVGKYEIAAALDEQSAMLAASRGAEPAQPAWRGWDAAAAPAAPPGDVSGWSATPGGSAISGTGPMSQSWAPPAAAPPPPPPPPAPAAAPGSGWGASPLQPTPSPTPAASGWGTPAPSPGGEWASAASGSGSGDLWGKFEESNAVDWARGGFGAPEPPPPPAPVPQPAPAAGPGTAPAAAPPPSAGGITPFLVSAGLAPAELKQPEGEALSQAGMLLRRMIAGLVVMLEARARAKSQMGAAGTGLELAGNNPLKFARTPEQAIAMMLNPAERGFMSADRAVEDSFRDLQAHQMATLKAMQGALRVTLDRFSPKAIRGRATLGGFLAKIFPPMRDAQLWRAYEREFSGVAYGSDEAFMDMFAKEFRRAYEDQARQP